MSGVWPRWQHAAMPASKLLSFASREMNESAESYLGRGRGRGRGRIGVRIGVRIRISSPYSPSYSPPSP